MRNQLGRERVVALDGRRVVGRHGFKARESECDGPDLRLLRELCFVVP